MKHQEKIDQEKNVLHLSSTVKIDKQEGKLFIHFPNDFNKKSIEGSVKLYCPSDENKDYIKSFKTLDTEFAFVIPTMNKGLHEIHLSWNVEGVNYYYEYKMML